MKKGIFTKLLVVFIIGLLDYVYYVQKDDPAERNFWVLYDFSLRKIVVVVVVVVVLLSYADRVARPPSPKICCSPGGPPVTAPRIKLRDGRHLAYKEFGVPKDHAKRKIVFLHGGGNCRHDFPLMRTLSSLPNYIGPKCIFVSKVIYHTTPMNYPEPRPGYGESDPHPKRTPKTLTEDVEELVDFLELGSKFYIMGYSLGGQAVWHCLKYIPHRLAGASLLAPAINYWWSSFPANLVSKAYQQLRPRYRWAFRFIHHLPSLTYWWNTQKFFPTIMNVVDDVFSRQDIDLFPKVIASRGINEIAQVEQQGVFESLLRDLMVGFEKQEFDPMKMENPFPNGDGCVKVWMGDEDSIVTI